jgi:hypothetical protein
VDENKGASWPQPKNVRPFSERECHALVKGQLSFGLNLKKEGTAENCGFFEISYLAESGPVPTYG